VETGAKIINLRTLAEDDFGEIQLSLSEQRTSGNCNLECAFLAVLTRGTKTMAAAYLYTLEKRN
jgi:hypothetical protein